jgi:hypothetical protein
VHTSIEILLNSSNITFSPDQSFELDTSVYCLRNFQNLKFYFSSNFNAVFQTMIICRVVIGSLRSLYYLNKWVFKMNTNSFLSECFHFFLTSTEKKRGPRNLKSVGQLTPNKTFMFYTCIL